MKLTKATLKGGAVILKNEDLEKIKQDVAGDLVIPLSSIKRYFEIEKAIEILKPLIFCGGCTTATDKEISSCNECDSFKAKQLALEALEMLKNQVLKNEKVM